MMNNMGNSLGKRYEEIISILPLKKREFVRKVINKNDIIQEIRMRVGRPLSFYILGKEIFFNDNDCISDIEMQETIEYISRFSLYAYEDKIRQGFITIQGGHRIGLAGTVVMYQGAIKTIRNIKQIHIRIAGEFKDCARLLLPSVYKNGRMNSTLIFSPPGCGKTTILRDLIRLVSDGNAYGEALSVSVIDERGELSAMYQGIAQNDLGKRTDVLEDCPKTIGINMMLRSMSPNVIAIDEIGSMDDVNAILNASGCGIYILATAHGESLSSIMCKKSFKKLKKAGVFSRFVELSKKNTGKISCIYDENGNPIWQENI